MAGSPRIIPGNVTVTIDNRPRHAPQRIGLTEYNCVARGPADGELSSDHNAVTSTLAIPLRNGNGPHRAAVMVGFLRDRKIYPDDDIFR